MTNMMKGTLSLALTAMLVVGAVSAVPLSGLAQPVPAIEPGDAPHAVGGQDANGTTENASDVTPGAMLSGVVGVQSAELDGEMDRRTFGIRIARSASNESKADVVADTLGNVEERLTALEQRKSDLEQARENGTIGNATYDAEVAELTARASTVRDLANASEASARGLPADLLERKGIDVTAIRTLRQNASELTGPEVAAIARSIAGPDVGRPVAGERARGPGNVPVDVGPGPGNDGPPDNASTGTDSDESVGVGIGGPPGNASTDAGGDESSGDGVDGSPGDGVDVPVDLDKEETETSSEDDAE